EASLREVINGDRDLRQEPWMPVQIAGHVKSHPRALGERRHRAKRGPPVEDRRRRIGTERDEVVERPDVVETRFVADPPHIRVDVDRMYLLRELEPEAKWMSRRHVCRIQQSSETYAGDNARR